MTIWDAALGQGKRKGEGLDELKIIFHCQMIYPFLRFFFKGALNLRAFMFQTRTSVSCFTAGEGHYFLLNTLAYNFI